MEKRTVKPAAEKIFVFGASGHAKVVIDIIEKQGLFEIAFLVDDDASLKGRCIFGYPVVGGKKELAEREVARGVVAIGSNHARRGVAAWLTEKGYQMITVLHPSAQVARGVTFGNNCVVMAGAVVNSDCRIGNDVIINTKASIDHDCLIGDGVHLAPGTTLCGAVEVGAGTFICAGATVIPNVKIGSEVVVGAGTTVIADIPDRVLVVGTPARIAKSM